MQTWMVGCGLCWLPFCLLSPAQGGSLQLVLRPTQVQALGPVPSREGHLTTSRMAFQGVAALEPAGPPHQRPRRVDRAHKPSGLRGDREQWGLGSVAPHELCDSAFSLQAGERSQGLPACMLTHRGQGRPELQAVLAQPGPLLLCARTGFGGRASVWSGLPEFTAVEDGGGSCLWARQEQEERSQLLRAPPSLYRSNCLW